MGLKSIVATIFLFLSCRIAFTQTTIFYGDDPVGCAPHTVQFTFDDPANIDTDTITTVSWSFGNGQTSNQINPPLVTYNNPGTYTVSVIINGYSTTPFVKTDYISVGRKVIATFEIGETDTLLTYELLPQSNITDASATYFYRWHVSSADSIYPTVTKIVNTGNIDNREKIVEFSDAGNFLISLVITDTYGCKDSIAQQLLVTVPDTALRIQNVFAPNSPTMPYFVIDPGNPSITLLFEVFTRTGILVYKTESQTVYWDGKNFSGQDLNTGVYFYSLKAVKGDPTGYYTKQGFFHLYR